MRDITGTLTTLRFAKRVAVRMAAWAARIKPHQPSARLSLEVARATGADIFELKAGTEFPDTEGSVFTVVIPTMDRAETIADTIRTCLAQEDRNFRIIVSDNASIDDTAEVVRSFSDSRLRYINPISRLGMAEHWEFALGHVEDGYVTVLGDDDGLLPDAVTFARRIIGRYNAKALSWRKVEYHWPDHIEPSFRDWLQVPLGTEVSSKNSLDVVKAVVEFRDNYTKLPCIYNSFVSTDLIRSFQAKNSGLFFVGANPDICSAFAIAAEAEQFVFCQRPLSINGASSKSNGTMQTIGNKNDSRAKSFWSDTSFTFEPGIPQAPIVEFCVLDSFLKVGSVAESFSSNLIDKRQLIESAVLGTFGGYIPENRRTDRLDALKEYADTVALLEQFERACERGRQTVAASRLPKPGYYEPDNIIFDASSMEITDVYLASLRVAEILDFKTGQADLFQQLLRCPSPEAAIASFVQKTSLPKAENRPRRRVM